MTKTDISELKTLLGNLATKDDISAVRKDIQSLQNDIVSMKNTLNDFASAMYDSVGNLLEWSDDIHQTIVTKKLPERVTKLEQIIKSS